MKPYQFAGGNAVVTGAASGIGEALARGLGERGSSVVLLDRDAEGLDRVAGELRARHPGREFITVVADLSDREAVDRVGASLATDHLDATLLINCAGVALGGNFDQVSMDDFDWLMDINFRATVVLSHHLLPVLRSNHGSHLANVSSVFGLFAPAGQAAYVSSKFAVRGFTEAIRTEAHGTGLGVTAIHPGGIRTAIARNARIGAGVPTSDVERGRDTISKVLTISPADAAEVILQGIERRSPRVLIGMNARIPDLIARLSPGRYMDVLRRVM